jgi:hypothetical protein
MGIEKNNQFFACSANYFTKLLKTKASEKSPMSAKKRNFWLACVCK